MLQKITRISEQKKADIMNNACLEQNQKIGRKLREIRMSRGLSQQCIADSIGISFQQIQKYEKGINGLSAVKLLKLAHLFMVPTTYFFSGIEEPINQNDETFNNHKYIEAMREMAELSPTNYKSIMQLMRTLNGKKKGAKA